jgi:uncharacterized protein YjdB
MVTATALTSIAVTPASPSVAKGLTQQFTAIATYADLSTQDVTASVTWTSSTPAAATIAAGGLATGVAVGTTTITAISGTVTGSQTLTVQPPVLVSITVTPANPSVAKGLTQQFTATGHYSDASVQDLTGSVAWASSTTTVATINASGLATSVASGTTTISATDGGVTGSTVLTGF